jgi:hypothetical protein
MYCEYRYIIERERTPHTSVTRRETEVRWCVLDVLSMVKQGVKMSKVLQMFLIYICHLSLPSGDLTDAISYS